MSLCPRFCTSRRNTHSTAPRPLFARTKHSSKNTVEIAIPRSGAKMKDLISSWKENNSPGPPQPGNRKLISGISRTSRTKWEGARPMQSSNKYLITPPVPLLSSKQLWTTEALLPGQIQKMIVLLFARHPRGGLPTLSSGLKATPKLNPAGTASAKTLSPESAWSSSKGWCKEVS